MMLMAMCFTQVFACAHNDSTVSVPAQVFEKEIRTDSVLLLDVRTPEEYSEGHIEGAININVQSDDFRQKVKQELSKDSTVLVYCRSGK